MTEISRDEELDELVAACLERMEEEGAPALEALCAEHPELAADLRRRVGLLFSTSLLDPGPAAALPRQLGDFELREPLGSGAMGVVHVAWQRSVGREVAVKLVRPELLLFEGSRARFQREALLVARLKHPAILPILALGEEAGVPWFATELVRGCGLDELLQRVRARFANVRAIDPSVVPALVAGGAEDAEPDEARAWRPPRTWRALALGIALELAHALAHAHGRGVLHRDVKPSNVLLSGDGRVFLSDFGLAAAATGAADGRTPSLTRTGTAVGSLPYLAPELLEGRPADVRSDVYALGAVLHELLTLRRAFDEPSPARLVARILTGERPAPRRVEPALGLDEEAVIQRALERTPELRYPTASALAEDLERLLERRPTAARPAGPALRLVRLVQRRPTASLAAALGVLLVVGGPLVLAWTQGRARRVLQAKNDQLDAALASEAHERGRAESNLSHAVQAIDLMLRRTGETLLEDVPQMQSVRKELLQSALRLYEDILPQDPSDPGLVLEACELRSAAAGVHAELGERDAARALLQEGLELLDGCAGCEAHDPGRATRLHADLLQHLGLLESDRDPGRGVELLQRSVDLRGELPADDEESVLAALALEGELQRTRDPAEAMRMLEDLGGRVERLAPALPHERALQLTAKVLVERGSLYHSLAKDPAAAEDLRAGVAALDELAGLRADSTSIRVDRAIARINLTAVLLDLGDVDGAADAIHRARADAEWLVASFPDAEPFRRRLAGALINEGLVLRKRGDDAGCREAWERAVELGAELVASPRPSGESLLQAGMALGNLCSIDRDEDRLDECLEHADRADEILSRALELSPKDMLVARSLQYARITRERAWLALDELEEARAACEAAAQVAPVDPQAQRAMADGWLELASHAPDESESLETRALAALQRAVELGWNDAVDLEENPLLAPLRARPGFPAVGTH